MIPARTGTPAKLPKRKTSKVCPGCGARFHTRTRLQQHLRESLKRAEQTARDNGLEETANEIAATLNAHRPKEQHGAEAR